MNRIVTILPKDEGFSPARFGAISLCVRDFTLASRYRDTTTIISGIGGAGFDGIHFRPAPTARWYENRTRAYARHCIATIKREGASLVEIHNRPQLLNLIASHSACTIALHLHNDPQEMRDSKKPAERQELLRKCAAVYCVSEYIRGRFLDGLRGDNTKVHVIHNGIAIPRILPPKEKLILFAGRMTEGKGALLLAQALALALPRLPDWRAMLIGSDRHSAAQTVTSREAAIVATLAPVAAQATMQGFLRHEETLAAFARASIAVVPSLWQEPFGRTAIEAMAYGCAVVSSGRGALRDVTGDAALTLDELTSASLAQTIMQLAADDDARAMLQQKARARAEHFAIAKCAGALDKARAPHLSESRNYATRTL